MSVSVYMTFMCSAVTGCGVHSQDTELCPCLFVDSSAFCLLDPYTL